MTAIKIILVIVVLIALVASVTSVWRLFHDWFLKAIPNLFWGIVGLIVIPIGFTFWISHTPPPDAKTKAMYQYIINQYNGKNDNSIRTHDLGKPYDSLER